MLKSSFFVCAYKAYPCIYPIISYRFSSRIRSYCWINSLITSTNCTEWCTTFSLSTTQSTLPLWLRLKFSDTLYEYSLKVKCSLTASPSAHIRGVDITETKEDSIDTYARARESQGPRAEANDRKGQCREIAHERRVTASGRGRCL